MTHVNPQYRGKGDGELISSGKPSLPFYTQTHRVVSVKPSRAHLRVLKQAYDPDTHAELRMNLECEADVEAALLAEAEAIRSEAAIEREAFFATLAVR